MDSIILIFSLNKLIIGIALHYSMLSLETNNVDCVTTVDFQAVQKLVSESKKGMPDFDYQLPTNLALIYKLANGQVALVPSVPSTSPPPCLLFQDEACLQAYVARDHFPLDNYNKHLADYDVPAIKAISSKMDYFQDYLNNRYHLTHRGLTRAIADEYFAKVIKDRATDAHTIIALGAMMGEVLRRELNGKWVLQKLYGAYNPYYQPMIQSGDQLVLVYDRLASMLESRNKNASFFYTGEFYVASKAVYEQAGIVLMEPDA